jgi:hypothetical protein
MDLKAIIKDGVPRLKSYFSALPWKKNSKRKQKKVVIKLQ